MRSRVPRATTAKRRSLRHRRLVSRRSRATIPTTTSIPGVSPRRSRPSRSDPAAIHHATGRHLRRGHRPGRGWRLAQLRQRTAPATKR